MGRVLGKCTVSRASRYSWAVNIPAKYGYIFGDCGAYTILFGDHEIRWSAPKSFRGLTRNRRKHRRIVRKEIRDWLASKGKSVPCEVLLVCVNPRIWRLALSKREVKKYAQSNRERFYIEAFLKRMDVVPESLVRGGDPPDYLLTIDERQIAIEMTEFYRETGAKGGKLPQQAETEWRLINDLISEKKEAHYPQLRKIDGFLAFRDDRDLPSRGGHKAFVKEVLDFASSNYRTLAKGRNTFTEFENKPLLTRYLKRLVLVNSGYFSYMWSRSIASFVGISEESLTNVIEKKLGNPRPPSIAQHILLVVSGGDLSQGTGHMYAQILNNYDKLDARLSASLFDKVYIFSYTIGQVIGWDKSRGWVETRKWH